MTTEEYLKKISADIQKAQTTLGMPVTQFSNTQTTPTTTEPTREEKITQLGEGIAGAKEQLETIKTGLTTLQDTELTSTGETPELPQQFDYDTYFGNLEQQYQQQRLTLESTYQKQIDDSRAQQDKAREEMQKYQDLMKDTLDQADPTQRSTWEQEQRIIQNKLDAAETASETIEKNFMDNQRSIGELESLLTEAMKDIQSAKSVTGLGVIRQPRIAKIQEDYAAREGIIRSVMAARDNQIGQAHNIIDSAMNNIKSNWNEQLTYYNAVLGFYDKLRDEEGNRLINLERDEKNYINAQIGLIENDMARAQQSADYIKQMMMDPSTAGMMEAAGVKITDTPQQIQAKLAQYQYSEELRELSNKMSEGGATRITAEQAATLGEGQVITQTDTKGNVSHWKVPAEQIKANWELRTIGDTVYRINPDTGEYEPVVGADAEGTKIPPWFRMDMTPKIIEENADIISAFEKGWKGETGEDMPEKMKQEYIEKKLMELWQAEEAMKAKTEWKGNPWDDLNKDIREAILNWMPKQEGFEPSLLQRVKEDPDYATQVISLYYTSRQ